MSHHKKNTHNCQENFAKKILPSEAVEKFNSAEEIIFTQITPKKVREFDAKKYMAEQIKILDGKIIFGVKIFLDGTIKPVEVLKVLNEFGAEINILDAKINRTALLSRGRNLLDLN